MYTLIPALATVSVQGEAGIFSETLSQNLRIKRKSGVEAGDVSP